MKVYTAHLRPGRLPVLVREGFSLAALVFGWIWLLLRGAWTAALLLLAAWIALLLLRGPGVAVLAAGLLLFQGLFGNDLRRLELALRGYRLAHVVVAPGEDAAFARLLSEAPDLLPLSGWSPPAAGWPRPRLWRA